MEKVFLPKLSLWYSADFGKDMKSRVAKLLLISQKGGKSSAVLTALLGRYEEKDKAAAVMGTYISLPFPSLPFISLSFPSPLPSSPSIDLLYFITPIEAASRRVMNSSLYFLYSSQLLQIRFYLEQPYVLSPSC